MFTRLLFIFEVIAFITVGAVDLQSVFLKFPELQKCASPFQMFDASGKLPNGILSGNWVDLGQFDQCLEINEVNDQSQLIKGKYCIVQLNLPSELTEAKTRSLYEVFRENFLDFPEFQQNSSQIKERISIEGNNPLDQSPGLMLGWCVPHTCPIGLLSDVLSLALREIDAELKVTPVLNGMCQTNDDLIIKYDTKSIIYITFLTATLFIMIVSTVYDAYIQRYNKKPAHIILIAFSVKTNGAKLLSVTNNPNQLACLNGIRVLSRMWDVYSHKLTTSVVKPVINQGYIYNDWQYNPANMYMLNSSVAADTFFILSALLVGYGYCKAKDKGVRFNIFLFYLRRFLKLTPILGVIVWFHATIFEYFGSGPFWHFVSQSQKQVCEENWWSTLIYIQNYYAGQDMCLGPSWYLAVDMQMFILSPVILIPLWKWPKQTLIVSAVLVLASMASSFAITYINDFAANKDKKLSLEKYYYVTHARYGPWLMGLLQGYFLFTLEKSKNYRKPLHPATIVLGWIAALGVMLVVVFGNYDLQSNPDRLGLSFYNGFNRHVWTLGVCWVIYACSEGYGGPINSFLSGPVFQVLGRFDFAVYLVHLSFEYAMAGSTKTNLYFSDFRNLYVFWGDYVMSLAISICLTLGYDLPMVTIDQVLFKTGTKLKTPEPKVSANLNLIICKDDPIKKENSQH